jgi:uncharacterized protein (TIGR03790 family)
MARRHAGAILLLSVTWATPAAAALSAADLGILYRAGDPQSEAVAREYQRVRGVPAGNLAGLTVPTDAVISPATLAALRATALRLLPAQVQAVLLVWTRPYAVGCMSITTAFAAGYRAEFCEPGCGRTALSPVYDADSLDAARRGGWRLAMLFPDDDMAEALALLRRGTRADATSPRGTVYLVETKDAARNVRAANFAEIERTYARRVTVRRVTDSETEVRADVLAYFTGVARVKEIHELVFRPGAVGDHLTSVGGLLDAIQQTTALEWLRAGATGSYGTVSEPCNHLGKFPSPMIFLSHYLRGDTLIEAYWKSVAMPGQGLFVGEPLARPFAPGAPGARIRSAASSSAATP